MSTKEISADPLTKIWKFFASVRLTIVLLLTLAATSIIGTLIPQNQSPSDYVNAFGAFVSRLFDVLGLFDLYHSWWFQTLMLMLAVNVLVCSIERLSATWQIIFDRHPKFNISRFRRLQQQEEYTAAGPAEQLKTRYQSIVSRHFRFQRVEETEEGFAIFAEKGRWTRIGVYVVHLSIIFMLVGALIGSIFGFEGFVNITEGDSAQSIRLRNSGHMFKLNFAIRCDDFDVSFYDTGAPKEYRSSLTILEQGKPVLSKDIIVNDPLHYKGISIFQSSYGELPATKRGVQLSDEITLNFNSKASGMIYEKKARIGQPIEIPENLGKFVIDEFRNDYNFQGQDLGAAIVGTLHQKNGVSVEVVLPVRFPSFDKMGPIFNKARKDEVIISVADIDSKQTQVDVRYYTGLQVAYDPGVWVVYSGFMLMILGCYITFFMSHRQICVDVHTTGDKCRIKVTGTANKNKLANERKVKKIAHILVNDER